MFGFNRKRKKEEKGKTTSTSSVRDTRSAEVDSDIGESAGNLIESVLNLLSGPFNGCSDSDSGSDFDCGDGD